MFRLSLRTSRPGERHLGQRSEIQLGVDAGHSERAMAQHVGYGFEGGAAANHMSSYRVSAIPAPE